MGDMHIDHKNHTLEEVCKYVQQFHGFDEVKKDSREYGQAHQMMIKDNQLNNPTRFPRLFLKKFRDVNDYMYFIVDSDINYISGGACGEKQVGLFDKIYRDVIVYYGVTDDDIKNKSKRYKIFISAVTMD